RPHARARSAPATGCLGSLQEPPAAAAEKKLPTPEAAHLGAGGFRSAGQTLVAEPQPRRRAIQDNGHPAPATHDWGAFAVSMADAQCAYRFSQAHAHPDTAPSNPAPRC